MRHTKALLFALTTCLPNIALADWSGYYVGGAIGSISGAELTIEAEAFGDTISTTQDLSDTTSLSGFGGILMQSGQFVYGAEIEISSMPDLKQDLVLVPASATSFVFFGLEHTGITIDLKARAGMSFGQVFPYGVVGITSYAFEDFYTWDQTGFSAGVGVDFKMTPNLFVGVEYLARSASGSANVPAFDEPVEVSSRIDTLSVRAGFTF